MIINGESLLSLVHGIFASDACSITIALTWLVAFKCAANGAAPASTVNGTPAAHATAASRLQRPPGPLIRPPTWAHPPPNSHGQPGAPQPCQKPPTRASNVSTSPGSASPCSCCNERPAGRRHGLRVHRVSGRSSPGHLRPMRAHEDVRCVCRQAPDEALRVPAVPHTHHGCDQASSMSKDCCTHRTYVDEILMSAITAMEI